MGCGGLRLGSFALQRFLGVRRRACAGSYHDSPNSAHHRGSYSSCAKRLSRSLPRAGGKPLENNCPYRDEDGIEGNHNLSEPIAALPLQIFTYAISPYDDWHRQAWAGALVLVTGIFCINVLVRI